MALSDLERLGDLVFPEFSCLCELCDCGRHKHHQNCKKNGPIERAPVITDCLLTQYQSNFTQPLNIQPHSSKRPLGTLPYPNPPAMQCETTQRSEFGQRHPKEQAKSSVRRDDYEAPQELLHSKSIHIKPLALKERQTVIQERPPNIHSGQPTSNGSNANKEFCKVSKPEPQVKCGETPSTAGAHDLNTTYQVMFQPLPFKRQSIQAQKRAKAKSAPMESLSKYRSDFPEYKCQPERAYPIPPAPDNLRINRNLPTDFNTIQRKSYIGWDTNCHHPANLIKFREEMSEREGSIDANTVTKTAYKLMPLTELQHLTRPMTMQNTFGRKFDDRTVYKNFFKNWGPKVVIRHGDLHDGPFIPPPGKIQSTSITRRDFTPKNVCKPMNSVGQQNTTVDRKGSSPTTLPMCRLHVYLLHQRLKGMKTCTRPAPIASQ
ncbi:stabilizer of axonemal microtubules 1-like isoform X2 [Heptranchias perlo]|uniref:stabilizer of axonemal microtubules 1-like isoform X2 n=1 Tax=Heptranchias perlo TaxID=212740 RepID=UPI00355951F1